MMKWSPTRPALVRGHMARLGIGAVRVTLRWSPGESDPRGSTVLGMRRAEETAAGRRLVLAVYAKARHAPLIARTQREYCGYVERLLALAPEVNDVVIWNEPNSSRFWRPAKRPSESPAGFYTELAAAYGELPRPADLRHDRPQPVPEHVGGAGVDTAQRRDDRRRATTRSSCSC
jgi:hypothetical protein